MSTLGPYEVSGSYVGDSRELLRALPDGCIQTCVTSPPYWGLRSYLPAGHDQKHLEIGLESTPAAYVQTMVEVFREVRRVLADDGTAWINLGDSYAGSRSGPQGESGEMADRAVKARDPMHPRKGTSFYDRPQDSVAGLKPKDLVGIPWMVAFALRDDGWYLRQDIIWSKPSCLPESVTDRCTKSHEYIFLLSKSATYFYDHEAVKEPSVSKIRMPSVGKSEAVGDERRDGFNDRWNAAVDAGEVAPSRNKRSVWTVAATPMHDAHFAVFPPSLIEPCILAGSRVGDVVLDPFFGSGTTGMVAEKHGRRWLGFDLHPDYAEMQKRRTAQRSLLGLLR